MLILCPVLVADVVSGISRLIPKTSGPQVERLLTDEFSSSKFPKAMRVQVECH
jgi:hypothetical protein